MKNSIICFLIAINIVASTIIIIYGQESTPEVDISHPMLQQIYAWFDNNPDCTLPCLWGLTVGKTTEDEFLNFLLIDELQEWMFTDLYLESKYDKRGGYIGITTNVSKTEGISITFGLKGKILDKLILRTGYPSTLNLIVQKFALVTVLSEFNIQDLYFSLRTWTDENRIIIRQDGWEITYNYDYEDIYDDTIKPLLDNRQYIYCLQTEYIRGITIEINPDIEATPDRRLRSDDYYTPETGFLTDYMPNEDFINFFIENPDECLITDIGEPKNDTD